VLCTSASCQQAITLAITNLCLCVIRSKTSSIAPSQLTQSRTTNRKQDAHVINYLSLIQQLSEYSLRTVLRQLDSESAQKKKTRGECSTTYSQHKRPSAYCIFNFISYSWFHSTSNSKVIAWKWGVDNDGETGADETTVKQATSNPKRCTCTY
jgi:hypothetical protein